MSRQLRRWSLLVVVSVISAIAVVVALLANRVVPTFESLDDEARGLERSGRESEAEAIYWRLLQTTAPTVPRVVSLLDAHTLAKRASARPRQDEDENDAPVAAPGPALPSAAISEEQIDAFLNRNDLPRDVTLLGQFWRAVDQGQGDATLGPLEAAVTTAADTDPPMPWANHLLGRKADRDDQVQSAAKRLLREGRYVPANAQDVNQALGRYEDLRDWAQIGEALRDPVVERIANPALKARYAVEVNDWKRAARWIVPATYNRPGVGPLCLAIIAAFSWGVFCAQLGRARERVGFRLATYAAAFVLGTLSVVLTDALILVEESKLRLVESGDLFRDLLFFTFGVGFREEVSKLILFLPLVPLLRRRGTKLDVLVAGAFVGLGFAAVENLNYLSLGDMTTGIGRFLTANFLHMAMTAIFASALDDFARGGDSEAPELSRAALTVISLHGLYDFFISQRRLGLGYLSMVVFFFLTNRFLDAVGTARGRGDRDGNLLRTFAMSIAVVCGATYVWASIVVGPTHAALAISEGLLGSAIIIYAFGRRFRTM